MATFLPPKTDSGPEIFLFLTPAPAPIPGKKGAHLRLHLRLREKFLSEFGSNSEKLRNYLVKVSDIWWVFLQNSKTLSTINELANETPAILYQSE